MIQEKKNRYEWTVTVEKIDKERANDFSEIEMCSWNGGDSKNLPTNILKEKIFKDIPYEYFTYSTPPQYDGASLSNNTMFRMLIESDLIENLKVRTIRATKETIYLEVSFDLPILIKNEVTALMASNYVKWIEHLKYRKNNYTSRLSRSSVKDFVLDAVFEQED